MKTTKALVIIPIKKGINQGLIKEISILIQDGGFATIHDTGDHILTDYYQSRINIAKTDIFEDVYNGKAYAREWKDNSVTDKMIHDAIHWLSPMSDDWDITYVYHEPDYEPEAAIIKEFIRNNLGKIFNYGTKGG